MSNLPCMSSKLPKLIKLLEETAPAKASGTWTKTKRGRQVPREELQKLGRFYRDFLLAHARDGEIYFRCNAYYVHCPLHKGGKENNPSLRTFIGENGGIVLQCESWGCRWQQILQAKGMTVAHLYPAPGEEKMAPMQKKTSDDSVVIDPDKCHEVYSAILPYFYPVACAEDWIQKNWHISIDSAQKRGYWVTPIDGWDVVERVLDKQFGTCQDLRVPGIYRKSNKKLGAVKLPSGICIPVRDVQKRIILLKIRTFNPEQAENRYLYFSSKGRAGGITSGVAAHVPLHEAGRSYEDVRITEGEVKADYATEKTGILTISAPGIDHWRYTLPALKQLGARRVSIAYDYGEMAVIYPKVLEFAEALEGEGYEPSVLRWEVDHGEA